MIGAIAGDIIGSRFEGEDYPPRDFDLFHADCEFTDDTICNLAIAEALLYRRDFARTLRRFVKRHPNRGYGSFFLEWASDAKEPPYGGWGNGAPMRVSAVGWLARDEADALSMAEAQSVVSHDHPEAIAAAQAVALTIFLLRTGSSVRAVRKRISAQFRYDLRAKVALSTRGFDASAVGTAPAALTAAFGSRDWEGAVRKAVSRGGDTDTLACIAGAVAEAIHGVPPEIAEAARTYMPPDLAKVLAAFDRAVATSGLKPRAAPRG